MPRPFRNANRPRPDNVLSGIGVYVLGMERPSINLDGFDGLHAGAWLAPDMVYARSHTGFEWKHVGVPASE